MMADVILYGSSESCYAPYGDHFRKVRKLVTVHLLSSKKVLAYRPDREEEVALVMEKLAGAATSGGKVVVDMSETLHSFANDLICRAVSGKFFRAEGRNKMFKELIDTNAALLGGFNLEDYFPNLARRKILCAKAVKIQKRWDDLMNTIIDDHVARLQQRSSADDDENKVLLQKEEDSDFLDILLTRREEYGLTMDHIKGMTVVITYYCAAG
ncbi:hypothetical protein PR202_gb29059 [Eleusine coracana subsp. coracana]|uniref:Uncharacterized protein n=1 Tax=Eleusine coracana subsp. coracana TaxID=191504 RepID=A0AAV5FYF3_ELECO|nr:hypothetical protein QOZ80_8BG0642030 [Eleusine coracana subsp. coracana]GJN39906.1 hypothetical protein PR202_gb29059 [Eleusine coracana subsp. coracana]